MASKDLILCHIVSKKINISHSLSNDLEFTKGIN